MTYGSQTKSLLVDVELKFERAEMQMIRWMCGISIKDRRTNEELRRLVGVEPITTVIRSGKLRRYGHVMRTRCRNVWTLELKAEDRLEDKDDVHDRKKWRGSVMKRKSNPIDKRTINR